VDVGALGGDDAVALVARRGELYDRGPDGVMAAIFPAPWEDLGPVVGRVADAHGGASGLAPAVFNSPTQTVVGGSRAAVMELVDAADEELYAQGVVVEERIPMHTPRFEPVAGPFAAVLRAAPWTGTARIAYRPNVTGASAVADAPTLTACLTRHVGEPVLWRDTVDALVNDFPDAVFLETGPRTVLRDLMLRRWHADLDVLAIDDPAAPLGKVRSRAEATVAEVVRSLAAARA
jgi:[acyl-carrier-protein] S-malonyltransferase